jgi:putative ABC transport system permease protein
VILAANVREAAASLHAARQRSLLTLTGIVIGIGSVIAMISVGLIVKSEALGQFRELGTEMLTVQKQYGGSRRAKARIRLQDALALPDETSSIAAAAPYIRSSGAFAHAGKNLGNGEILGVTGAFADLYRLDVSNGRFLSDLDFRRRFCVVGADVASSIRRQGGAERVVGESIRLDGRIHTVVGVLSRASTWGPMRQFDVNAAVLVPITTAQRSFADPEIRDIVARMRPGTHHLAAAAEVSEFFRGKAEGLQVRVQSAKQVIEQMQKQMQMFVLLLGAVGSISLIVGGIGVMNMMLVSVIERRREIGLRRALGARRADIQGQFLIESVMLSILGGVLGIAAGLGGTYAICWLTGWTFLFSPTTVALGVGVASAVGVMFGLWPARQASRLDPIAALRTE